MKKEELEEIMNLIIQGKNVDFLNCKYKKMSMNDIKELNLLIEERLGRRPRTVFYKDGKKLNKDEMSQEELEEYRLGIWRMHYSSGTAIENLKSNDKFEQLIEWIRTHKDEETRVYKFPRSSINRNGKTLIHAEMTEEEFREKKIGKWWNCNPSERRILERYQNISEKDFIELPEEIQNILLICNRYGIKPECKILNEIKSYVRDNVGTNAETRSKIAQMVMEFNKEKDEEDKKKCKCANQKNLKSNNINKKVVKKVSVELKWKHQQETYKKMKEQLAENKFNEYIKWIENHKNEETGEYKKPRANISINGRKLKIKEMTKDEKDEFRRGCWWSNNPKERKIIEDYQGKKIEEVPEEYRKIVEIGRKYGLEKNEFKKYIEWIENHKNEEIGEYKKPRTAIWKNGRKLKIKEMTKDEKEEYRLGNWWNRNSKERKIIEDYQGKKIEEVPEKYRKIVEIGRKYGLEEEERNIFNEYIKWIEEHKNEITGKYRKPRTNIRKNGRALRKTEMTKDEKEEYRLGTWWNVNSKERKIIETYQGQKIEEISEEYRKIVEIGRKYGLEKEERNEFKKYIEWIENHKDEKTGEYKKPRESICKNGRKLKIKEMTKDEKEEFRRGCWWNRNPKERKILKKYENISEEEFIKLPEEIQNILLICNRYGIKPECKILSKIKYYVRDNVGTNAETRSELTQKVMEFNEHKPNKNKLGKQEIIKLIKLGYNEELISFEYQLPIEYIKKCKSEIEEFEK